jgi:hypothetical protein
MKLAGLIIILITIVNSLYAQQKIVGRVLDSETNKPVRDAMIKIEGTSIGTLTNISGFFELTIDTTSRLIVEHPGYVSGNVKVTSLKNIMIRLTKRPIDGIKPSNIPIEKVKKDD